MDELDGKVAVVTGAASGIGAALAGRFASEGMRVVLADVEVGPLQEAADELAADGAEVLAVPTDVSRGNDVDRLAAAAADAFGPVHVLCNNAGVGAGGLLADLTTEDWEWVLGVNLWGVIHGLRAFLPGMLAHGEPGHIVNTASLAGLVSAPMMGPYGASKFAVVGISEALYHELQLTGSRIGASVLCPGWVNTQIYASERNRPAGMGSATAGLGVDGDPRAEMLRAVLASGMAPDAVADLVLGAIRDGRFYVLTHPEMTPAVEARMRGILDGHNPKLTLAL
jgi:NAD(P)-dependent dehydrogenase (short-subunit alcohol dehydrogenase family)